MHHYIKAMRTSNGTGYPLNPNHHASLLRGFCTHPGLNCVDTWKPQLHNPCARARNPLLLMGFILRCVYSEDLAPEQTPKPGLSLSGTLRNWDCNPQSSSQSWIRILELNKIRARELLLHEGRLRILLILTAEYVLPVPPNRIHQPMT